MKKTGKLKKAVLLFISLTLILSIAPISATAVDESVPQDKNFIIDSPYLEVDWESFRPYKAALHVHTIASDGSVQMNEVIEAHYALDFDILAITDHATLGSKWTEVPQTIPLFRLVKYERTKMADIIPLTPERYEEIINGVGRDGRGMLEVTKGIELNGAVPSNSHLNGYFADYGQGLLGVAGDYETPIKEVEKQGGITFLDHLGTYTKAYSSNNPDLSRATKNVNKFANIFINYSSCTGMDINSGTDTHTSYDRILYDEILQKTIPYGVVPWAYTFSDAHENGQWDRAFTIHMMPENSLSELRTSMENGTFFGVSRHARYELGNDFVGQGAYPLVTNVIIDDENDVITLEAKNYNEIVWVSNGETIAYGETIDLDDYDDSITCYVRAYLTGPGGICYTQPFTVIEEGVELEKEIIPPTFDTSTVLRMIVTIIDRLIFSYSPIINLFKTFALGL